MIRRLVVLLVLSWSATAVAQSTSIGERARERAARDPVELRAVPPEKGNSVLEQRSLIGIKQPEPRKFKVNDYITIIVRQQTIYEADATANARRQADLRSELDAFIKFTGGGVGAANFRRGMPNIDYRGVFNQRNTGEADREDRLTTRITAKVIDVKPNGNLVFEAGSSLLHDEEEHSMTLTGGCRSIDVTPDNTILSTQVADLDIKVKTRGGVRRATQQGWIGKIYDFIRPL